MAALSYFVSLNLDHILCFPLQTKSKFKSNAQTNRDTT